MTSGAILRRVFDERRRALLPLLIALAVNLAVLLFVVVPLRSSVTAAEAAATDARLQLGEAQRLQREAQQARGSKQTADEELQRFYGQVLPRDLPTAQKTMNLWVAEAARSAGLQFRGSHFDWGEVRDSQLSRAFSQITLQGSYPNIRRFLRAVETAEEFVVVERVELVQQSEQVQASGPLEVSLVVATYYQTKAGS